MKKIKSPWYGAVWILIWTAALFWFVLSGMFTTRESVGLIVVWLVMVGITVYLMITQRTAARRKARESVSANSPSAPSLNALCPCGSGKKFKRCCGAKNR